MWVINISRQRVAHTYTSALVRCLGPDNRRPVPVKSLSAIAIRSITLAELLANVDDGPMLRIRNGATQNFVGERRRITLT